MEQNNSFKTKAKALGFVVVSSLVHLGLATAVVTMNMDSAKQTDGAEVEFLTGDSAGEATAPVAVEITQTEVAETTTQNLGSANTPAEKNDIVQAAPVAVAPAPVPAPAKPAAVKAPAAPAKVAKAAPVATEAQEATSATTEEAPIQTTDTSLTAEAEALDTATEAAAAVAAPAEFQDAMIAEDLAKVDEEHQAKLATAQKDLEEQNKKAQAEQAAKLAAAKEAAAKKDAEEKALAKKAELEKQEQAKAAAAEKAAQEETQKQAAAEAQAKQQADEKAQALAAAKAAEQAQVAKAAADAAAAAAVAKAAETAGNGNNENKDLAAGPASAEEVRTLEQLKQKPGNPRPLYSSDDRLKGRAGEVAFLAYISKEGAPVQFKMVQSSGHRELDAKTLKTLKNWKFQPGQEGWVEIPFKWDLKGGPQEMPATLRRAKVSQN